MAAEKASHCSAYWSAGGTSIISMPGSIGGGPPTARINRVGLSGGMLNGISTSSRPSVPMRWTRWSSSSWVEHVKVACRPSKSSTADVSTSVPKAGSRRTAPATVIGSASNIILATLTG